MGEALFVGLQKVHALGGLHLVGFDGGSPDQIGTPYNNWRLIELLYNSENASWDVLTEILNSSSDPTTIPTSGWSPSITITAA